MDIYTILSHPLRRKILMILNQEGYVNYSDLLEKLSLETTGQLNFHLKKLGNLVKKDNKSYTLSKEGNQLIKIMNFNELLLAGEITDILDLNQRDSNELNRVGVIICNCNTEISNVIDMTALENYVRDIRNVVSVKILDNFCQEKYQKKIEDWVKEHFISKIVIGACSPKSHQHVFERIFDGIIEKYNIEYANIREQCCWVHLRKSEKALKKTQILIEAAVERVILQRKISVKKVNIVKNVAIIGGGVAGMTVALDLARAGIKVKLIEKSPTLGGKVSRWDRIYGMGDCSICFLSELVAEVAKEENIEIFTNTEIENVSGEVGNFKIDLIRKPRYVDPNRCTGCKQCSIVCPNEKLDQFEFNLAKRKLIYIPFVHSYPYAAVIDEEDAKNTCQDCKMCEISCVNRAIDLSQETERFSINVGIKVIAVGADLEQDLKKYHHNPQHDIITSAEFERLLSSDGPTEGQILKLSDGNPPKSISIIQCVDKDKKMPEFFDIIAMKYRSCIKRRVPGCEVNIFYQFNKMNKNRLLLDPMDQNIHYAGSVEVVDEGNGETYVESDLNKYPNKLLRKDHLIILNINLIPNDDLKELRKKLDFTLEEDGFMSQETLATGIFGVGTIMGPLNYRTTISQAHETVIKIISMLSKDHLITEAIGIELDESKCGLCGLCTISCPYNAITIESGKISYDKFKCKGCGTCVSVCPTNAIQMNLNTTEKILKTIETLSKARAKTKVIAFCCQSCGYAAADEAGLKKYQYNPNIFIVKVPCTGRIDASFMIKSLESGFDGVMIIGCKPDACKFIDGVDKARKKTRLVKDVLANDTEDRIIFSSLNAVEGRRFADNVNLFLYALSRKKLLKNKKKPKEEVLVEI